MKDKNGIELKEGDFIEEYILGTRFITKIISMSICGFRMTEKFKDGDLQEFRICNKISSNIRILPENEVIEYLMES